jgi:hypothetical protein
VRRVVALLLLSLSACDSARVLSADGSKVIGSCGASWVKCIHEKCPNGYDVIDNEIPDQTLIRCKPPTAPQ